MATEVALTVEELEPIDPAVNQRRLFTLIAVMMALGQVMTGAYAIASGTVEEKTSRVIEVVVSKVHPRALLTGKLVGLGAVLFLQLLVFVAVGLVGLAVSPDLAIPEGLVASSWAIALWYLLGFATFSSLFAIAAALSARQEDMAQKMAPMMYLLFAGFYAFANPDTLLTRIVTYVPFTAPAVLPARQTADAIAGWEIALAVAVALLAAALAVRFAGRVYTAGALRTRGTSTVRKVLQSSDV